MRPFFLQVHFPAEHSNPDRYEKRHKNLAAHLSPAFRVEVGDVVTVGTSNPTFSVINVLI